MNDETISLQEFERYVAATRATERRLRAENTWLRHRFTEIEARVALLKKELSTLKSTATRLKKSLGPAATQPTKKRSKK